MTNEFDLGHDLDLEFSRSNIEFAISQPKMVRLPRNEKQTYWLNSRPQMWPMVWIYQIVTGVTSVVGVPSTHLVYISRSDTTAGEQTGSIRENYVQLRTAAVHQPCHHTVSWQPGCSQTKPGDYCTEESTGFIAGWGMMPCLGFTKLFLDCYWSSTHP